MKLLDFLMRDERGYRALAVDQDHEGRLRCLEEENRRLREVLRVVVSALQQRGIVDMYSGELVVPGRPGNPPHGAGAKFACSRCGSLLFESELARVEGSFVCEPCNVEPEPDPIDEGSYR